MRREKFRINEDQKKKRKKQENNEPWECSVPGLSRLK
jgi:hypothetical protein